MIRVSFFLFFISCFCHTVSAQEHILRKVKPGKKHKAWYATDISQQYEVTAREGTAGKEEIHTNVHLETSQDILEKKSSYFQADYNVTNFHRIDSTFASNGNVDTATNRAHCPLIKIILQYDKKGNYTGPVLNIDAAQYNNRDFRYFYNSIKDMVYAVSDSANTQTTWHTRQCDTTIYTGFEMVLNYTIEWKFVQWVDSMGMKCALLHYTANPEEYRGTSNMMKALGIDMTNTGKAAIWGTMLVESKTGRVMAYEKYGKFTGMLTIKSPREEFSTPSEFIYKKITVLTRLEKLPRKKFLGLF